MMVKINPNEDLRVRRMDGWIKFKMRQRNNRQLWGCVFTCKECFMRKQTLPCILCYNLNRNTVGRACSRIPFHGK